MYKQNLKTECTDFAILWDKQSRRYCKTICKNLHHHFLSCRLQTSRSQMRYPSSLLSTSVAWWTRSRLWWQCRGGRWMVSLCPSRTFTSTFHCWCRPSAWQKQTSTPTWSTSTLAKVGIEHNFKAFHHTAKNYNQMWPSDAVPCEFLTVNNLLLFDLWR